jgi:hypothetical protein
MCVYGADPHPRGILGIGSKSMRTKGLRELARVTILTHVEELGRSGAEEDVGEVDESSDENMGNGSMRLARE